MTPHPALAILKAGDVDEAIRILAARGDHPSALAILQLRFIPEAICLLEEVEPLPLPEPEA